MASYEYIPETNTIQQCDFQPQPGCSLSSEVRDLKYDNHVLSLPMSHNHTQIPIGDISINCNIAESEIAETVNSEIKESLLDTTSLHTTGHECKILEKSQEQLQYTDFNDGAHQIKHESTLDQQKTISEDKQAPRRVVGRPHITILNVLRTPNVRTTSSNIIRRSNTKDSQRVTYHSTPTWSTSKHVTPISSSSSPSPSFNTPSFSVRQPISQLNPVFDVSSEFMQTPSFYSTSFNSSTSSGTIQEPSPDFSPVSSYFTSAVPEVAKTQHGDMPLEDPIVMPYFIPYVNERENHNIKERHRRARVAHACTIVKGMIPGLGEKTDKASVFEQAVDYLEYLKSKIGETFDQDFLDYLEENRIQNQVYKFDYQTCSPLN